MKVMRLLTLVLVFQLLVVLIFLWRGLNKSTQRGPNCIATAAQLQSMLDDHRCLQVIIHCHDHIATDPLNITRSDFVFRIDGSLVAPLMDSSSYKLIPGLPSYHCERDLCSKQGRRQPFILIHGARNVALVGKGVGESQRALGEGVIDGRGAPFWSAFAEGSLTAGRPRLLSVMYSERISISGLSLVGSAYWATHVYQSTDVTIHNVEVVTPSNSPNTDGFVIDSSSRVTISDSIVSNGNDCITIKSGTLPHSLKSDNITIERIKCRNGYGLSVGSETAGGVSNVLFSDISLYHCYSGCRLKRSSHGGFIENVTFANIFMTGVTDALRVQSQYLMEYENESNTGALPLTRNILYRNLTGDAKSCKTMDCDVKSPCENMQFVDVAVKC